MPKSRNGVFVVVTILAAGCGSVLDGLLVMSLVDPASVHGMSVPFALFRS
jgi:hypothetical protein